MAKLNVRSSQRPRILSISWSLIFVPGSVWLVLLLVKSMLVMIAEMPKIAKDVLHPRVKATVMDMNGVNTIPIVPPAPWIPMASPVVPL